MTDLAHGISFKPSLWRGAWVVLAACCLALGLWHKTPDSRWQPQGDQSVHLMATMSLWHDADLRYTRDDLDRFVARFPAADGPRGIFLKENDQSELHFAKPFLYALVNAPFYGLLGSSGFFVVNLLALGGLAVLAHNSLRPVIGAPWAHALTLAFFGFSPHVAWLSIIHPDLLITLLLGAAGYRLLTATDTRALLLGGALMGLAIYEKPTFAVLLPFVLSARPYPNGRALCLVLASVAAGWLLPTSVNLQQDGHLLAYQGVRYYVEAHPFPFEPGWQVPPLDNSYNHVANRLLVTQALGSHIGLLPGKLLDSMIGRQTGLLLYHPVAIVLIWLALRRPGKGRALLWGLLAYQTLNLVSFPNNGFGGAQSYGSRYVMQALPLLWLAMLPGRTTAPIEPLSPSTRWLAALCVCLAVVFQHRVLPPSSNAVNHPEGFLLSYPARLFPLEASLLPSMPINTPDFSQWNSDRSARMFFIEGFKQRRGTLHPGEAHARLTIHRDNGAPLPSLTIRSTARVHCLVRSGERIVWQGVIDGGRTHTVGLQSSDFSDSALDLMKLKQRSWGTLNFTLSAPALTAPSGDHFSVVFGQSVPPSGTADTAEGGR